jgi:hypothetical protein
MAIRRRKHTPQNRQQVPSSQLDYIDSFRGAPSTTPTSCWNHFIHLLSWFIKMPFRRCIFLLLYFIECIFIVPFRIIGCCSKNWSIEHAESKAIEQYFAYQNIPLSSSEEERLQNLFEKHSSHRITLKKILPELYKWYPMGRLIYDTTIIQSLRNKLLLLDYYHDHKKIPTNTTFTSTTSTTTSSDDKDLLDTKLPPTIWIVGLPRTGSTYFHSILALDTDHIQTYKQWELRTPVPSRDVLHLLSNDQREKKANDSEWLYTTFFSPLNNIRK